MSAGLGRIWVLALAIVCGMAVSADARRRGPDWEPLPLACESTQCPPEIAKLYDEEPTIELVTMGVGSLIWERHGHIALCLRFHDRYRDVCYNYGVGDFGHPLGMAWGFFRGTKSFWVGKIAADPMLDIYRDADRSIWVQPLPLSREQKQQVIAKLESDILEQNKYYAYDHFWDNCTTRVRDILDNATGGALRSMNEPTDGRTFRDLAREGFYGMRVPLLITDIAMGAATDRVPSYYERMFLPDYLREAVAKKWGIQPITVYERKGPPSLHDGPSGRLLFALVILLATAPVWLSRLFGRFQRLGLAFSILPPTILGFVLWFLAIISPLPYVETNETMMVFFPFDILLLFLRGRKQQLYARGRVVMLVVVGLLNLAGVLKQPMLAPLLWPLIPAAVVGFWRPEWTRGAAKQPVESVVETPDIAPAPAKVVSKSAQKRKDKARAAAARR
ncbi:MAG TPA: DUF4105 domain-containing protein [Kofleriaceae bacterium]|nr:DUF4105 domain-containing protein [Kofleriaceae bacterium]